MSLSRWFAASVAVLIVACGNPLERGTEAPVATSQQALDNGTCSHPLDVTGPPLVASCASCAGTVCSRDPYCCNTYWDSICVNEANSWCAAPAATTVLAATFEAPVTSSTLYQPVSSDWLYAGSGVQGANYEGGVWVPAPQGTQQGFLQSGGSLSRTVGLTGGSHTLSFLARRHTSQGGNVSSPVEVRLNGGVIGVVVPSNTSGFALYQVAVSGSGNQNLSIVNVAGGAVVLIDDLKLVASSGTQLVTSTFESPSAGGSFIYQPASADFFYTGAGVQRSAYVNGGWLLAAEGQQFGFFQSGATMERVVSFTASGTHTLTFKIARSSQLGGSMSLPLNVTIDGAQVASFVTSNGTFTSVTASFPVNAGNRSVKFTNTAGAALTFIDDLKLTR